MKQALKLASHHAHTAHAAAVVRCPPASPTLCSEQLIMSSQFFDPLTLHHARTAHAAAVVRCLPAPSSASRIAYTGCSPRITLIQRTQQLGCPPAWTPHLHHKQASAMMKFSSYSPCISLIQRTQQLGCAAHQHGPRISTTSTHSQRTAVRAFFGLRELQ